MVEPQVYISIVNWNEKDLLEKCLKSIYEVTEYGNYHPVVVDNGSDDDSVDMVRSNFPDTEIIENNKNVGFAKANNQVFQLALDNDVDYVVMLNNDARVTDPGWLETLVTVAEDQDDIGAVGCEVRYPDGSTQFDGAYFPRDDPFFYPKYIIEEYRYNRWETRSQNRDYKFVDEIYGAVFLIKRSVLQKVGKLDENYSPLYYEEIDFCARLWDEGFKVAYTDKTSVLHAESESTKKVNQAWLENVIYKNKMRFILTNYPLDWILYSILAILCQPTNTLFSYSGSRIRFRSELKTDPVETLRFFVSCYLQLLIAIPGILRDRDHRKDIKSNLK